MRVTISIPDTVAKKFYTIIPNRRRSQLITELIKKEIQKREALLEKACILANADTRLQKDIDEWQAFEEPVSE